MNCTAPEHVAGVLQILSDTAKSSTRRNDTPSPPVITVVSRLEEGEEDASSPGSISLSKKDENLPSSSSPVLVAYPNSGEIWDATGKDWVEGTGLRGGYDGGVGELGLMARKWFGIAGTRVFGGCCRTRPTHITEIRKALLLEAEGGGAFPTTAS